jgi:hypothetical protein
LFVIGCLVLLTHVPVRITPIRLLGTFWSTLTVKPVRYLAAMEVFFIQRVTYDRLQASKVCRKR